MSSHTATSSGQVSHLTTDTFRLLVESIDEYAIFVLDTEGRVMTWNIGAQRINGYSSSEIVGRHFSAFYLPEDIAAGKPERELRTAAERGRVEDEGWRVRKDGSRFWANVLITALRDENGNLNGFGKITRDLTEQRAAAEELQSSEERFRLLVEGVRDYAVYMLDPTGHVSTWNSGAEKIKGYRPSEIIGRHYSAFFTPEDASAGRPEAELRIARSSGRYEEEGLRVRKDGTRFWANVVLTALRSSSGELIGFAKVTRDLTARKLAEETARELLKEQAAREAAEHVEERLREERERFQGLSQRLHVILESVADGITVQDRSGNVIFANTAAATICGFSSTEEFLRATPAEVVARFELFDEQAEPFDPKNLPGRKVLNGAETASAVVRVRERASGRQWWTVIRSSPVLGEDGQPQLAVNIWHDVSADRRREEHDKYVAKATATLSASLDYEQMLRSLAGLLVPGLADWCSIHVLDGDDLQNVAVSHVDPARVARVHEYAKKYPPPRDQARGVWNVIRTGVTELYDAITDEMLQRRAQDPEHLQILRDVGMTSLVIVPIRARDAVTGTLSLVSTDSTHRYDGIDVALAEELGRRAGTAIENARLYAAERKAREQLELIARVGETFSGTLDYEETLRSVVEVVLPTLGDFAFFDIVEGEDVRRIAAAHDDVEARTAIQQTSWIRSDRSDKNVDALRSGASAFHPQIDAAWRDDIAASPEHAALLHRLQLGSMLSVPVRGHGQLLGALTACFGRSGRHHSRVDLELAEEIARRAGMAIIQSRLFAEAKVAAKAAAEAARAAEEASRVKDEFLATVSHELRTPLNAIVGWSSLLRERAADPEVRKGIEVISRNAQMQGKIIEDILDVSRIITGKLRLDLKAADLVTIVGDAVEVIRPSASAKGIAIDVVTPAEPCSIVADPDRLQQVVWNVLSNAVKFTDPGGSIRVVVERERSQLRIGVSDTGRGIDPEFMPYVFDRFKQADASTTRRVGGLGLGLAIVRHIVELHGGQVTATSPGPGLGSTFSILLPVRAMAPALLEQARPSWPARESSPPLPKASLRGLRVLVVDDEPDARDLLRALMENAGARVQAAASAVEAFELLPRFCPSVIVSDIGMADEDGYGLMRRIRALSPDLGGRIPSIALTAYARRDDKTKALAAGFTTHIGKPVNPDELLAAVANLAKFAPKLTDT